MDNTVTTYVVVGPIAFVAHRAEDGWATTVVNDGAGNSPTRQQVQDAFDAHHAILADMQDWLDYNATI